MSNLAKTEKSTTISKKQLELEESLAFFVATNPSWKDADVAELSSEKLGTPIDTDQVALVRTQYTDLVKEYRLGGLRCLEKALALGRLPYGSIYDRILSLGDIADKARHGYLDERVTAKGDILQVKTYNFPAAIEAIKLIGTLVEPLVGIKDEDDGFETVVEVYNFMNTTVAPMDSAAVTVEAEVTNE